MSKHPTVEHPIVRTHPETGRRTLYVNFSFTRQVVGMEPTESTRLLTRLYRQSTIVDSSAGSAGTPARWPSGTTAPPSTS